MTARDISAFVRIVRELYPNIVFLRGERAGEQRSKWSIVTDPAATTDEVYANIPEPGWDPEEYCAQPSQPWHSGPRLGFTFRKSFGPFTRTLENGCKIEFLTSGVLYANHARSDRDKISFLGRVWRASGKIMTNRTKIVDPETGRTVDPLWKYQWCGFDALHWCRERDNRFLEFSHRPTDDWAMPDSPYYD